MRPDRLRAFASGFHQRHAGPHHGMVVKEESRVDARELGMIPQGKRNRVQTRARHPDFRAQHTARAQVGNSRRDYLTTLEKDSDSLAAAVLQEKIPSQLVPDADQLLYFVVGQALENLAGLARELIAGGNETGLLEGCLVLVDQFHVSPLTERERGTRPEL